MAITAYGIPLSPVTSLEYFERVLSEADVDWPKFVNNLQIAWWKWAQLTRVLSMEVVDERTLDQIYLAVVHLVMIYESETRIMTPHIGRVLGRFHHRVACRMIGRQPRRGRDGL